MVKGKYGEKRVSFLRSQLAPGVSRGYQVSLAYNIGDIDELYAQWRATLQHSTPIVVERVIFTVNANTPNAKTREFCPTKQQVRSGEIFKMTPCNE